MNIAGRDTRPATVATSYRHERGRVMHFVRRPGKGSEVGWKKVV